MLGSAEDLAGACAIPATASDYVNGFTLRLTADIAVKIGGQTYDLCKTYAKQQYFYAAYIDGSYYKIDGDLFAEHKVTDKKIEGDFKILAPVSPSKIIALGVNYRNHAAEMGEEVKSDPLIFMKPPTAVIAPYENIEIANPENRTDYEAELAVIIKSKCSRISADEAENYILGYTCANDVPDRVLQKKDGQWVRAKGFDTYCPLGPHIVTGISPMGLRVQSILNGEVRQDSTTDKMINNVFDTVAFIRQ